MKWQTMVTKLTEQAAELASLKAKLEAANLEADTARHERDMIAERRDELSKRVLKWQDFGIPLSIEVREQRRHMANLNQTNATLRASLATAQAALEYTMDAIKRFDGAGRFPEHLPNKIITPAPNYLHAYKKMQEALAALQTPGSHGKGESNG